jgi:hypothetical protein
VSTTFFIAPYTRQSWIKAYDSGREISDSDLQINPETYKRALSQRWPLTQFEQSDPIALSWILPSDRASFSGMRGHLYPNLQGVSFSGTYKDLFVNFILWYRAYIPASYRLYYFNSSEEQSTEIKPDATEDDIIKITGIID